MAINYYYESKYHISYLIYEFIIIIHQVDHEILIN